jgi:hypothetical protein
MDKGEQIRPIPGLGVQPTEDGKVRIIVTENRIPVAQIEMPPDLIGGVISNLMSAAITASNQLEQKLSPAELDKNLTRQAAIVPSGFRLVVDQNPELPQVFVIEAGHAQMAVAISEKWLSELGRGLLAASAAREVPRQ